MLGFFSDLRIKKGNTLLSFLMIAGFTAFLVFITNPSQDIFLGAQVGKGGVTTPNSPVLDSATPGDEQVDLVWTTPADGGSAITDYMVSIYLNGKTQKTVSVGDGSATSYSVTGLTNDTEYAFEVYAVNALGNGKISNSLTATPTAGKGGGSATVPGVSSKLTAVSGDGQVELSWFAPDDDGGAAIEFYYVKVLGARSENILETNDDSTTYTVTGLKNDVEYTFSVAAVNSEGEAEYSDPVSETPASNATVPNTPTGVTVTPGDQTLAISWTAPANGGSAITGYIVAITPSGGDTETVNIDANNTSYLFEGLKNGTAYLLKVLAQNSVGDSEYSTETKASPDENTAPAIVGKPTVQVTNTTAIITWSTNKSTSTKVDFGLLTTKTSTPEYNKDSRVANHSVTITDLVPCTTYSYVVKSYDALSQVATSSKEQFTTKGCIVAAEIKKVGQDTVDTTLGGTLDFTTSEVQTKLTVPQNVKTGETDVVFEVKKLEKTTVKEGIGLPVANLKWLGEHVYDFSAYSEDSEDEVNNFDEPITVTIEYTREDVQGIDLNTLKIHHYEESTGWSVLNQCTNTYDPKTGQGEISCKTNSFSIFGLFGEDASGGISTGVYVSQTNSSSNIDDEDENDSDTESKVEEKASTTKDSLVVLKKEELDVEDNTEIVVDMNSDSKEFEKDLWYGIADRDVQDLQRFLNNQGFTVAEKGPGSPGRETGYFGPLTLRALKKFQLFYQGSISRPTPVQKLNGYLDYFTREFIQNNF